MDSSLHSAQPPIRVVCATQVKTEDEFWSTTLLGTSLGKLSGDLRPKVSIKLDNGGNGRVGLSRLYNLFLQPRYQDEVALFVHDDVSIDDWYFTRRLWEALAHFDVIGVAGNADPDFAEPSWCRAWNRERYADGWQPAKNLSGNIAHRTADMSRGAISRFGPSSRRCRLLDGVFLAVKVREALRAEVRFDEQFEFHLYDLDFCRAADAAGLRLGTWPIAITHGSEGQGYGSEAWSKAAGRYLAKWGNSSI
jgi:hypothetical protein